MEVLTALALAAGVGSAIKTGAGMYQASTIFSDKDERRLRRLERLQAAKKLGMTEEEIDDSRNQLTNQIVRPGMAVERQSRDTLAAQQSIADIGSGQAARQQAAITGVAQKERGRAEEAVEQQLHQQKMLAKQQDLAEIAMLRERKKEEDRQFWGSLFGGAAEGVQMAGAYQQAKLQEANRIKQQEWMKAQTLAAKNQSKYLNQMMLNQQRMLWGGNNMSQPLSMDSTAPFDNNTMMGPPYSQGG
tara:strand:- start:68 stop:802 length:735 start_codon:yes stop_codon:yes gene_type:complete